MSGADLANLVNEAALVAVRRGSKQIERIDFENARDRVVLGAQRESLVLTAEEKRSTAYHEGGHALLATVLPHGDPLHKVTILPRGMALGVTWSLPEERHTYSKEYFEDTICKAMGGRVAEKIVFGHVNSGAANDLEQATGIARRMVREWGMSDRVGPMAWSSQQHVFLGEDIMTNGREYSDDTAKLVDEEVARILTDQEQRATDLLMKHRRGLELVAEALLEHETIEGREVARLIQQGLTESGDSDKVAMNVSDVRRDPRRRDGRGPADRRRHGQPPRALPGGRACHRRQRSRATDGRPIGSWLAAPAARARAAGEGRASSAAHRAEQAGPHHALGVGDHEHRNGLDAVALVQRLLRLVLHLGDSHVHARRVDQVRAAASDVGARVARRRREDGDEPLRVGALEVGPIELAGNVPGRPGRGRQAADGAPRAPTTTATATIAAAIRDPVHWRVSLLRGRPRSCCVPGRQARVAGAGRRRPCDVERTMSCRSRTARSVRSIVIRPLAGRRTAAR